MAVMVVSMRREACVWVCVRERGRERERERESGERGSIVEINLVKVFSNIWLWLFRETLAATTPSPPTTATTPTDFQNFI